MQAYIGEFIGTMIVITFGWAMAVAVAVYCVGQFSGAYINPAVTIGFAVTGGLEWALVPGYIIAQFLGAFVGAVLVWLAYLPHWAETEDQGLKLGVFCTAPAIYNTPANVITEIIGTFVLVFGVSGLIANAGALPGDAAAVIASGLNPLLVGLLVLGIGLSLGGPTGYAINPARDLGPRIAHAVLPIAGKGGSDWGYAWIPVVAPIIGGILGAVAWVILF
jgi:glycerol uptake facilitator protein